MNTLARRRSTLGRAWMAGLAIVVIAMGATVRGSGGEALAAGVVVATAQAEANKGVFTPEVAVPFPSKQIISTSADAAHTVAVADVDSDGDIDALSASAGDDTIAWYPNRGGQFALASTDTAPATLASGASDGVLRIDASHRGRSGDSDLELTSLRLRLLDAFGTPLTSTQANNLVQSLSVYIDSDASGTFTGPDTFVTNIGALSLDGSGDLDLPFADADPNAQVAFGASSTFFVVVELTATAGIQTPNTLRARHLTADDANRSRADDRASDVPLSLEYAPDITSSITAATGGCSYTLTPTSENFTAAGGSGSISVTTTSTCTWMASTAETWIHLTSCVATKTNAPIACTATGSGTVAYTVDANPGAARSGTITIEGETFTVNQDAAPVCTPPTTPTISGSTSVVAGDGDSDADTLVGYTYSVPPQSGASYTWSVSAGATIWAGQGTTAIQVVFDQSAGPFTVSVTIDNGCGSVTPSSNVTKLHNGFSWDFLGTGTPAGWTNEIGPWAQNGGSYENPAHTISPATLYESVSYGQVYGDFTVEASIVNSRTTAGTQGAATTLWVRGTPTPLVTGTASRWNSGYAFNIANTGRFSIFKYTPSGNTSLQAWVVPVGVTIFTDGVTANVLKVEATGTTMAFSINGVVVKTITGQTQYPTGKVGVAMVRTSAATGDAVRVNTMKVAPSPHLLSKRGPDRENHEQQAANAEANRLRPSADPLFDDGRW
jgi:hypothetical protein